MSEPAVAVSPATGDVVVAWATQTYGVQAARFNAATQTWGSPVTITDRSGTLEAAVAVDGNGHYVVIWSQRYDVTPVVTRGIWASFSNDGVTWSASPVLVYDGGATSWDADLRIAMNRSGQARAVWDHFVSPTSGDDHHMLVSTYLSGTTFGAAAVVSDCVSDCIPRVAIDSSGSGMLVWEQPDPVLTMASVWAASYVRQTVATPALVENYDADSADMAEVTINDAGQGIAVWRQRATVGGSLSVDLVSRRFSVANGWAATPQTIGRFSWALQMSVAVDSAGTAYLGTSRYATSHYQAMFGSQAISAAWTTEVLETDDLAPDNSSADIEPQLALAPGGDLLMGWRKKISSNEFPPHVRWRSNNAWGAETEFGAVLDMFSSDLRLGVADDGTAVAAWTYYHCDPGWEYASTVCPTAKTFSSTSTASQAAWGSIFVSVYR